MEVISRRLPGELRTDYRSKAKYLINEKIGSIRQRHITTMPGQDMIYAAKESEAKSYLEAFYSDDLDGLTFPLIAREVGITAETLYEVSQVIVNMAQLWRIIAGQLDEIRLGYIRRVEMCASLEECDLIIGEFNSVLDSL